MIRQVERACGSKAAFVSKAEARTVRQRWRRVRFGGSECPNNGFVHSEMLAPGRGGPLAARWRARQLEASWLRTAMDRWADFQLVTRDALDVACAEVGVDRGFQQLGTEVFHLDENGQIKEFWALIDDTGRIRRVLRVGSIAFTHTPPPE